MHSLVRGRRLVTIALLGLGVAAAGCGSDGAGRPAVDEHAGSTTQGPADPVRWAGTFCGGLHQVITSAAGLGELPSEPQAQQDALLAFAESVQQSLDGTAAELQQLGPPDVPDGSRTHQVVLDYFTSASETTAVQRERIAALDPEAADFEQQLAAVVSSGAVTELSGKVMQVTTKPELAPAFRDAPECQEMRSAPR